MNKERCNFLVCAVLLFACLGLRAAAPASSLRATPGPSAPFVLPPNTVVLAQDDSGKTWRMTAQVPGELSLVRKALFSALSEAKFKFKHETPLDEDGTHLLSTWVKKGRESLLLLVWAGQDGFTYFSWGTYQ